MPLVARWAAGDAQRVRAALAAAFGVEAHADGSIAVTGLRLEIADADVAPGGSTDRLDIGIAELPAGSLSPDGHRPQPVAGAPTLRAVGWATVDIERAAGAWSGVRWAAGARDSSVGARALVGELTGDAAGWPGGAGRHPGAPLASTSPGSAPPDLAAFRLELPGLAPPGLPPPVLLEPDTEGRLAAALARHGEGPAVLYVELPEAGITPARRRLERLGIVVATGTGPFGPQLALAGGPAWSPTVILLTSGRSGAIGPGGGPAVVRRGTIRP